MDGSDARRAITRKTFLRSTAMASGILFAGGLFASCGEQREGQGTSGADGARQATLRIGFVPESAFGSVISLYMRDNELVQKRAEELGIDLQVEWREFPGSPPEIQALIGNDIDIAGTGFVPVTRAILQGQDLHLLSIFEGSLNIWLAVRPDSPIRRVEDLNGKTVGTFVGGDIEFFLTQLLRAHLDSPDPAAFGINVVNVPSKGAMQRMPSGVDAVTIFGPNYLAGVSEGTLVGLVANQGDTGSAWTGEEPPDAFDNSFFYPEGYILQRAFWVGRGNIIRDSPKLTEAFLLAQHDAIQELKKESPEQAAALMEDIWNISPETGAALVTDDLLWQRPWSWITEGELEGLADSGKLEVDAGIIEEAITKDELVENLSIVSPIAKKAYEKLGYPDTSAFTDPDAEDIRGRPFWELVE